MQLITVRMTHGIERRFVVHRDDIDYERVAIPLADGVAHPSGIEIFRLRSYVRRNRAENMPGFVENHNAVLRLDNLNRIGSIRLPRHADRKTWVPRAIKLR